VSIEVERYYRKKRDILHYDLIIHVYFSDLNLSMSGNSHTLLSIPLVYN